MTEMKKALWLIGFLLILSSCTNEETIKIGFIGPLTGDVAFWGIPGMNGMKLAVQDLREEGIEIQTFFEDGKCSSKEAVSAGHLLLSKEVDVIISACSAETQALIPLVENKDVYLFTYATKNGIPAKGNNVYRAGYSDADTAEILIELLSKHDFAIIYEQTAYAEGQKEDVIAKTSPLIIEAFAQSEKDVRIQVTKVLEKNPEAIFVDPDSAITGLIILNELKKQGFDGMIYGNFFGSAVAEAESAQGMVFVSDPSVENSKFWSEYNQQFGEPSLRYPAAAAYDSIILAVRSLRQKEILKDYNGILGSYTFDNTGQAKGIKPAIKQIKNKTILTFNK